MRRPFTKRGSSGYGMSQRSRMGTKSGGGAGEAGGAAPGGGGGAGGAAGVGAGAGARAGSGPRVVSGGGGARAPREPGDGDLSSVLQDQDLVGGRRRRREREGEQKHGRAAHRSHRSGWRGNLT